MGQQVDEWPGSVRGKQVPPPPPPLRHPWGLGQDPHAPRTLSLDKVAGYSASGSVNELF